MKGHGLSVDSFHGENLPGWIAAYFEIAHLKQLYRQGWLRRGIPRERCESVAEHTFGTALLAWWLAQAYFPDLDSVRVLRLALLHDLGEVYAGDLIPEEGVPPAEKHARELESVQKIFAKLPEGKLYLQLWLEFEEGSTPEGALRPPGGPPGDGAASQPVRSSGLPRAAGILRYSRRRPAGYPVR